MGPDRSGTKLTVVIPVYGSAGILPELIRQLNEVLTTVMQLHNSYEIILVNDCGPDNSWEIIQLLSSEHHQVKAVGLRKNAGQHNAIMAGLSFSTGDVVVMMDDDLQHSPSDIPILYNKIQEGYDVCYGNFESRHHARWKLIGSFINDRIASYLLKKPRGLYLSPFKAIRREVRDEIIKYSGPHVYLDGLILSVTDCCAMAEVTHHPRFRGVSGYGLLNSISLWLKMATSFSIAPLRLASMSGMLIAGVGFALAIYLALARFVNDEIPAGWTSLAVLVLVIGGIQLVAMGAIGEYLGRVFLTINQRPQYVVASTLNFERAPEANSG